MRATWDQYFIQLCYLVASRATCLRRRVGAVIVRQNRIVGTGYNGAPSGQPHCSHVGCMRETLGIESGQRIEMCRAIHAEQNAIIYAGRDVAGAILYCTTQPCVTCAKMLVNAGIARVVVATSYADDGAIETLRNAGVPLDIVRCQAFTIPYPLELS